MGSGRFEEVIIDFDDGGKRYVLESVVATVMAYNLLLWFVLETWELFWEEYLWKIFIHIMLCFPPERKLLPLRAYYPVNHNTPSLVDI